MALVLGKLFNGKISHFRILHCKGMLYTLTNNASEIKGMEYLVYMQMIVEKGHFFF